MMRTIGSCSQCGGAVTTPVTWAGVQPPVPQCSQCGATAKPMGPVIETQPVKIGGNGQPLQELFEG